ncbi:hypothetical protein PUN28_019197 [Cardiocondyla obscurior]|uniref:Uncharacterized protein n=1 Tax=Cardiocondyla obscurior TaxID=286306 RepID=A0AAW2ECF0_9HYME
MPLLGRLLLDCRTVANRGELRSRISPQYRTALTVALPTRTRENIARNRSSRCSMLIVKTTVVANSRKGKLVPSTAVVPQYGKLHHDSTRIENKISLNYKGLQRRKIHRINNFHTLSIDITTDN